MLYDVTVKRMSEETPTHVVVDCEAIEEAVDTARGLYPGGLIINVFRLNS